MLLRAAVSGDFDRWRPVGALEELAGVVHDLT
jgi:hypothetical protein